MTAAQPQLPQSDKQKVFIQIRMLNRHGRDWTEEEAEHLAEAYYMDARQVFTWGKQIYKTFEQEYSAYNGSIVKKIECYLVDKWTFRRNTLTGEVMQRAALSNDTFVPCRYNDIWRDLQHNIKQFGAKAKIPIGDVQHLLESDFVREFNPVKDYLESLPAWDGVDYIQKLADHVQCEDQAFWSTQFKKAMVRQIGCSFGGFENRIVMTLYTKEQSKGKNRFIKFLAPPPLRTYFKEDPLRPNKDAEIALTQNILWHLDELEALNWQDMSSLKSFISRSSSKQRLAYARQEETRKRIVNFWASTNKEEFLTDTQNARWLIFRVKSIDWNYHNEESGRADVDIDLVWAQAWHLYKTKFNYQLDEVDRVAQDQNNKNFETVSIEKNFITKFLTPGEKDGFSVEFMTAGDVYEYLQGKVPRLHLNQHAIKPSMTQLGFSPAIQLTNGHRQRGWWVIKSAILNGTVSHEVEEKQLPGEDLPF